MRPPLASSEQADGFHRLDGPDAANADRVERLELIVGQVVEDVDDPELGSSLAMNSCPTCQSGTALRKTAESGASPSSKTSTYLKPWRIGAIGDQFFFTAEPPTCHFEQPQDPLSGDAGGGHVSAAVSAASGSPERSCAGNRTERRCPFDSGSAR